MSRGNGPAQADAVARRHIAQWRRITARLQVLVNTGHGAATLAGEAHALRRQCERLACDLGRMATAAGAGPATPPHRGTPLHRGAPPLA